MSNELVQIEEAKIPDVFVENGLDPYIKKIRNHVSNVVADVSTESGRKELASTAYKIAKSRAYLDAVGKDYVAALKQQPKIVDAERKRMREELETLQADIRKPLTEWEDKEKARIAKHEVNIQWMVDAGKQYTEYWDTVSLDKMHETMRKLNDSVIDDSWDEYKDRALEVKGQTVLILEGLIAKREKKDAEEAELELLREKQREQEQKDREARIAQEAAEKAKVDAEAKAKVEIESAKKAEREAQERAERAEEEKAEAARLAKEEKELAEKQEIDRIEAQRRAEEKRQANKTHRSNIEKESITFISEIGGVTEKQATKIVSAIINNEVPNVSIQY